MNVVGAGDAENDQAFLSVCGCSVAVANALETVKANADVTTRADHGAGVAEFIDAWLTDPANAFKDLHRHDIYVGETVDEDSRVTLPGKPGALLIAGSSGAGKSRLTTLLVERVVEAGYQIFIVDPEGDYDNLDSFAHLGDAKRTPPADEVIGVLDSPHANVVVNLLGTEVNDRPDYFNALMGRLGALRTGTGRPQWLVLDEAHHLSPRGKEPTGIPSDVASAIFVTTHPENLSDAALAAVTGIIAVGENANAIVAAFCAAVGRDAPPAVRVPNDDQVLYWDLGPGGPVRLVDIGNPRHAHLRHTRKYAEGRLGEDKSFYFRGPGGTLSLRAYNLATFLELAQGVDDDTWLFHLHRGDYTHWFRDAIGDEELARETGTVELLGDAAESRAIVAEAVKRRYAVNLGP